MKKNIIIILLSVVFSASFEWLLFYLFDPFTGDMALLATEIAYIFVIIPLLIGISFILLKSFTKRNVALFCLLFVVVLLAQVFSYSSEFGNPPYKQISQFINVYRSFPKQINYQDLYSDTNSKKIAALVKFKSKLPDRIIKFDFQSYGSYIVFIKGKDSTFTRSDIKIDCKNDSAYFSLLNHHKTFKLRQSLIRDGSGQKIDENNWLNTRFVKFQINSNFEKLMYKLLIKKI